MSYFIFKVLITAFLIVIISEIAKTNDRMGGLVAALPITTIMILFWLYYEKTSTEKISTSGVNSTNPAIIREEISV